MLDRREFLNLPVEERRKVLAEQASAPEMQTFYDSVDVREWLNANLDTQPLEMKVLANVVDAGVKEAARFFGISDEIEIRIDVSDDVPDDCKDAAMFIDIQHAYLRAKITAYPPNIRTYAEAWEFAGHEVAHLVTREIDSVLTQTSSALRDLGTTGMEQATTRLQRLFIRECPYPGDEAFEGKKE